MSQDIGPVTPCHGMSLVITLTEDCATPVVIVQYRQHTLDLSADLVQAKLESPFKPTKRIIDRFIIVTLETAAVTLITTLVQLILYSRPPTNSLNRVGIIYILGGLYSNVLLSVLNSRRRARHQLVEPSQTFSLNFAQQSSTTPLSSIFEEAPSSEVASKTQKDEESHVKSESSPRR
ncbi:uncharacterized protein LACBIDRAFT_334764 [Laccaria bicolor S238N-H82]|uniref:Predicted protein n=1 Tax=Laccaria bicolor (strain S238N-H82 / ATCC MYA-4686) TaxID=486041 RepID=B0E082_LACBS|nr:uncharacterized protein LACBIDRAFT_334764 [Laccaria bicolor S238N-H82]EDQ99777.1 predicted protein [Laccaria bicolor S238N-H82]|eukprot:XP_001889613.1 predicted protein [Laccaria bicolor S238N-H82]